MAWLNQFRRSGLSYDWADTPYIFESSKGRTSIHLSSVLLCCFVALVFTMSVADAGLSERGLGHYKHGEMREGYEMLYGNLYHPKKNPTGDINLGISENVRHDSVLRSFDFLSTA